ncbi:MAG: DUF2207 domain-containing protein [Marmoricola sp.]
MKRVGGALLGLAVVVLMMFFPALTTGGASDTTPEYARITDYNAKFDVDAQGTLHATETLNVNLPLGKHGIFRFFDVADPNNPHVRLVPEDISVTRDGKPDGLDLSREGKGRFVVAKIGRADTEIDGDHTYVISYRVKGVLAEQPSGGSDFFWNLVPSGWRMPIDKSTLTATLTSEPSAPKCAIGVGSTGGCKATLQGNTITVTTGALVPNTPVTVQTNIDVQSPGQVTVPWSVRFDPVFGRSVLWLVLWLVLAALAAAAGWVLARSVFEPPPSYPLMYAPPEGIGPAQGAYLLTERVNDDMYAATMLELGQQGLAEIDRTGGGWKIQGARGDWGKLDTVSQQSAAALGIREGSTFEATSGDVEGGKTIQAARRGFDGAVKAWSQSNGLMESRALPMLGAVGVVGGAVVALACFFVNPLFMSVVGLPFALFAVFGIPLLLTGATTFRTRKGRDAWSRLGGFRRVLGTPSSEARFDFSGRKELYTAYIPWAVAFGCADVWAEKYRVEVGEDPPAPAYFVGGYLGGGFGSNGSMGSFSDSFSSSMHSAISAYQATQSSSSGGGGGGFSGGGGGGGGGGGSW